MLKLPDGTVKVLVEGTQRATVNADRRRRTCLRRLAARSATTTGQSRSRAMRRAVIARFVNYVKLNKKIPPEVLTSIALASAGSRSSLGHHCRTCRSSWSRSRKCWNDRRQGASSVCCLIESEI